MRFVGKLRIGQDVGYNTDKAFRRLARIVSDEKRGRDMKTTDGTFGGFATQAAHRERGSLGLGHYSSPRIAYPTGIVSRVSSKVRLNMPAICPITSCSNPTKYGMSGLGQV